MIHHSSHLEHYLYLNLILAYEAQLSKKSELLFLILHHLMQRHLIGLETK